MSLIQWANSPFSGAWALSLLGVCILLLWVWQGYRREQEREAVRETLLQQSLKQMAITRKAWLAFEQMRTAYVSVTPPGAQVPTIYHRCGCERAEDGTLSLYTYLPPDADWPYEEPERMYFCTLLQEDYTAYRYFPGYDSVEDDPPGEVDEDTQVRHHPV